MRIKTKVIHFMFDHFLPYMVNRRWKHYYGHKIDWKHPKDINEKMQWLAEIYANIPINKIIDYISKIYGI